MPSSGPSVTMLLGQRCGAALHLPTWRATGLGSAVTMAAVASRAVKKAATDGRWVHPKDLRKILKKLRIPISDETFEYACNDRRIIRYPKDPEMFSFATFFKPFLVFRTGRKRQAVAGQLEMFRHEALAKFRKHDINDSGTMNRKEVRMMMSDIHGEPVSVATVTHVLSIVDKGYTHEETITMDEVIHAVA